jgi:hypothetical protein
LFRDAQAIDLSDKPQLDRISTLTTTSALTMDMTGMSSTMPMSMGTATSSAAMPAATDADMSGMGGMGDGCKISVSMSFLIVQELTDMDIPDAVELEHDRLL